MPDIAFLMIVYFLLTSVFALTRGLGMNVPPPDSKQGPPDPAVVIQVFTDHVLVDLREMQPREIAGYLAPLLARRPDRPVVLYVEPDTPYQRMIDVYDELIPLGITNLHVPTASDIRAYVELFGRNPFAAPDR